MPVLLIRGEKTDQTWQVWPKAEAIPLGFVHETGSYIFELTGCETANFAELRVDEAPLEALRTQIPSSARWRWLPGFHAGTIDAELLLPGSSPIRFEIITDPDRRKLTRYDFDNMVREILNDTFALFSLSGFRVSVARGNSGPTPPIARLEFLRSRIERLEGIVEQISRSPRRRLSAEDVVLPLHRALRATSPEILRSFRAGRILHETASTSRLPAPLKGMLPERIKMRKRLNSLDLPEHRQMRACLRSWSTWLSLTAEMLERASGAQPQDAIQRLSIWAQRSRRLSRRVGRLTQAAAFVDVGDAKPLLALSAIFRNDPVYRQFYRVYQDINLGLAAVFGDFLNMPIARTFELYELWCFLKLVRAATELFGADALDTRDLFISNATGGVTLAANAVSVSVATGWKLCFQKQYREFWVDAEQRGSYSRTMTPDVVLAFKSTNGETPDKLIVLDAKYRIDDGLNDALSSIHTYRDSLVSETNGKINGLVTAAYLLTPHEPGQTASGYRSTPMPGRLFHPAYRTEFRFGAVSLRPGMDDKKIKEALEAIIADAGTPVS